MKIYLKTVLSYSLIALTTLSMMAFADGGHDTNTEEKTDHASSSFEEREVEVMPFDMDKTIHIFSDTDFGGIQQVIAMDSDDAQQVQLIQEHLVEQAQRFAVGDFGDPSFLHGYDMPGLTALIDAAKEGLLTVSYETLPNGAAISYSSENLQTIIDLHLWFQAQVTDHGSHATNQSISADTSHQSNNYHGAQVESRLQQSHNALARAKVLDLREWSVYIP